MKKAPGSLTGGLPLESYHYHSGDASTREELRVERYQGYRKSSKSSASSPSATTSVAAFSWSISQ